MQDTLHNTPRSIKSKNVTVQPALFEQYKNDRWAAHWGVKALSLSAERVILELPYKEIQLNQPNVSTTLEN